MKFSFLNIFITSSRRREFFNSTTSFLAKLAFLILVSMSAIGSVTAIYSPSLSKHYPLSFKLPAGLYNTRDLSARRQFSETYPAELEPSYKSTRPAAKLAPVVSPGFEFGRPLLLYY
jgi:hypothetical protein